MYVQRYPDRSLIAAGACVQFLACLAAASQPPSHPRLSESRGQTISLRIYPGLCAYTNPGNNLDDVSDAIFHFGGRGYPNVSKASQSFHVPLHSVSAAYTRYSEILAAAARCSHPEASTDGSSVY